MFSSAALETDISDDLQLGGFAVVVFGNMQVGFAHHTLCERDRLVYIFLRACEYEEQLTSIRDCRSSDFSAISFCNSRAQAGGLQTGEATKAAPLPLTRSARP